MIVHSGINKNLSNEAIFDTYDVSVKGMENEYLFNLQCFKHEGESEDKCKSPATTYQNCFK